MRYRRTNKLPLPGLQLRIMGVFAGLCAVSLLVQFIVLSLVLSELANSGPEAIATHIGERMGPLLFRYQVAASALIIPCVLFVGLLVTHRVAGPIFRFQACLDAIAAGAAPGVCRIRENDELHELCASINAAVARLQADHLRPEETPSRDDGVLCDDAGDGTATALEQA